MFRKLNDIIGIKNSQKEFEKIELDLEWQKGQFKYYNDNNLLPSNTELETISKNFGISALDIKLQLGKTDYLAKKQLAGLDVDKIEISNFHLTHETKLGKLFQGDCISYMKTLPNNCVDLIFADPPFNLNKEYKSKMDDNLSDLSYLEWSEKWLDECCRILKFGGSLFVWNLPKWNTFYASFLNDRLSFRNWIATDIKFSLPINGKLYPSHYSLLYYTKGDKPNTFNPDRLPLEICRTCFNEIKDYGGYKNKLNPSGITISDVWTDIPPVRHKTHKRREGANELSVKLLDRIIEMASNENDLVFDPFGGSGTTYAVAELKRRKWLGIELGPTDDINERFRTLENDLELLNKYRSSLNNLFPEETKIKRKKLGIWTEESFYNLENTTT